MSEPIHPNPIARIVMLAIFGVVMTFIIASLFAGAKFFTGVITILWGILGILAAYAFLVTRFITLQVSDREVIYKRGAFAMQRVHIPFRKITGIFMHQTLMERIFGLGTLEVDTAGGPFSEIAMRDMPYDALKRIVKEIKGETERPERRDPRDLPPPPPPPPKSKPAKKKDKHHSMYR
ncbi:TPA: hypothetical protein EYP38_01760 [Candidatus Micrarchaeota archaeon]|nr:hypothetical protein [Candidatus Micrarchaeota archaeon]